MLTYIHDHICEKLSAGDMAENFGYSRWYFSEKFSEYTGMTFVEYVRHYRLQLAALDVLDGKNEPQSNEYLDSLVQKLSSALLSHIEINYRK